MLDFGSLSMKKSLKDQLIIFKSRYPKMKFSILGKKF